MEKPWRKGSRSSGKNRKTGGELAVSVKMCDTPLSLGSAGDTGADRVGVKSTAAFGLGGDEVGPFIWRIQCKSRARASFFGAYKSAAFGSVLFYQAPELVEERGRIMRAR
jgi:hypothetical protein